MTSSVLETIPSRTPEATRFGRYETMRERLSRMVRTSAVDEKKGHGHQEKDGSERRCMVAWNSDQQQHPAPAQLVERFEVGSSDLRLVVAPGTDDEAVVFSTAEIAAIADPRKRAEAMEVLVACGAELFDGEGRNHTAFSQPIRGV